MVQRVHRLRDTGIDSHTLSMRNMEIGRHISFSVGGKGGMLSERADVFAVVADQRRTLTVTFVTAEYRE
jgi:hypothetical protein